MFILWTLGSRERERKAESKRNEQTANKQITIINFAVVCACLYVSIIFHHLTAQIPFYRSAVRSDHLWICNAVKWFPSEISRQPHGCESVSVFSRNAYRIRTEKRAAGYLLLSGDCNKKRRVYKVVVGSTLTQWISGFPCWVFAYNRRIFTSTLLTPIDWPTG